MTALGRFEPISSIAIRWSPRSDFAPATIANRKCRITTYEVPQSTRSEKWTKRTGSVHRSAKFDGQVKNCYVVEFTDNEPSPLNVDLGVAPESRQDYGQQSKRSLSKLVYQQTVAALCKEHDKYGRAVCTLYLGDQNINAEQVRQGLAWVYRTYAPRNSPLYRMEDEARAAGRGLWQLSNPTPPWEWRRQK